MKEKKFSKKLLLIALNELNFDVVKDYFNLFPGRHKNLEKLVSGVMIETTSETEYKNLEPWIQWVSVHSGLSYTDHGIFRLGDIVDSKIPQIFEKIESMGFGVGCISPMNAENLLSNPDYFLPDPWTATLSDQSWLSRSLSKAVSQAVNDNAKKKINTFSALVLIAGLFKFAGVSNYWRYLKLALLSRRARWRRALFLDLFLHDTHRSLLNLKKTNFSTLFLNAGAHIQHHYFFNAKPIKDKYGNRNPSWYIAEYMDPFLEVLDLYDKIIGDYLQLSSYQIIVATGLTQQPYTKTKFYYRLKNHEKFLRDLNLNYKSVQTRMTRDFVVNFENSNDLDRAELSLSSLRMESDDKALFGEIDRRENSLFVTLNYPNEISEGMFADNKISRVDMSEAVAFVAIKNGMHNGKGFAFFSKEVSQFKPLNNSHVKELHDVILNYFAAPTV
jgi:hypothetical protein